MLAALCALLALPAAAGTPRLVLVGGGVRPPAALERFVDWAGGPAARVVVVPWASSEPDSAASMMEDIAPFHPGVLEPAASTATAGAFEAQLASATGVFFTGGDQVNLMAVVEKLGLRERFQALSKAGVVFGGTSAGTAVMSDIMITGEGDFTVIDPAKVGTARGLGLVTGVIVDQHFLKRQRQNRLFGLVSAHPELLGMGVDEGSALVIEGTTAECVGPTYAMAVKSTGPLSWSVELVPSGRRYDLARRKLLPR